MCLRQPPQRLVGDAVARPPPRADIDLRRLERTERTTHHPIEGDTESFDLVLDDARIEHGAWSYRTTFDFADELVAFDTNVVDLIEHRTG